MSVVALLALRTAVVDISATVVRITLHMKLPARVVRYDGHCAVCRCETRTHFRRLVPFRSATVECAIGRLLYIFSLIIFNEFRFHHFFAKLRRRYLLASYFRWLILSVH